MEPSMTDILQHFTLLNFIGLMSIPCTIAAVAWRMSSRLTNIEVTLREYADANVRDHKRIIDSLDKHNTTLSNHGERIAVLEK